MPPLYRAPAWSAAAPGVTGLFAFLGGGIAWALHLVLSYGLTEIDCRSGRLDFSALGMAGVELLGGALTLLAVATAVSAAVLSLTLLPRGARSDSVERAGDIEGPGRERFMALSGLVLNALFALAILIGGAGLLLLRTCST